MKFTRLGRTSLQVSILGFGASTLGDEYGPIDLGDGIRAVHSAIDHGINYFDVSPYYGRTLAEERLGRALQGKRDRVVLSTKVGRYDRHLPGGFDFSAARVAQSVEESLRRLRTDRIDLLLAHDIEFGTREQILGETLPAMRRLQEQGKVRYVGVTGFPLEMLTEVAVEGEVDAILSYCHYNLLNTRLETELAPRAREHGIGLINASPLHMGVLTPEGPPPWHPAPPAVLEAAREAAVWCAAHGVNLSHLALRFAIDQRDVASTLVGMRSEAEVLANVRAIDTPPDAAALAAVRRLLSTVQNIEWPSGLPENNTPATSLP
ncbi:MAG TPA: aldo/keto reductase [Longimicrobiaceae bacterium]